MTERTEDRIVREVDRILKKSGVQDHVGLSEKIGEAVILLINIDTEESGIADVPEAMREEMAIPGRPEPVAASELPRLVSLPPLPEKAVVAAEKRQESYRASKAKSPIILPGDKEFSDPRQPKKDIISAVGIKRKGRPASNIPEVQYWDYQDLNRIIMENAPESVEFEIEGPGGEQVKLKAIRNTHCLTGQGTVLLTYRDPRVSENMAGDTVPLIARESFSLYDKEVDISAKMESIMGQLPALYKVKPRHMPIPQIADPGPLQPPRTGSVMGDREDIDYDELRSGTMVNDTVGTVQRQIRQSNDALAPTGRRF